jgi:hypothetical protein
MAESGDVVAGRSLVIGMSDITATKYLLDPEVTDTDGEWQLVQHHHEEEATCPSFLVWLEESVVEYRALATGEDGEADES